jgi:UDP-glucose 6-dehydrogenase
VIIPDIQPWMTFEYINKVFKLPPEYLRGKMSIQDASYPRMTLMGYAKRHQLNAAQFVNSVKDAVIKYKVL